MGGHQKRHVERPEIGTGQFTDQQKPDQRPLLLLFYLQKNANVTYRQGRRIAAIVAVKSRQVVRCHNLSPQSQFN